MAARLDTAARAGGHIALTGGSTPHRAYELAAELEPDWRAVELWWGDERCVPPEDELSNFRLAKEALLDLLAEPPAAVHRMLGELGADEGAARYERELGETRFDLCLLGLGTDGHAASLFPGEPYLDETERRVIGVASKLEPFVDRITVTVPVLCASREVLFLAAGVEKADAVARAFAAAPSRDTPASLIRSLEGPTTVVIDRAAAAKL